jgi:hypothetical protein
MQDEGEPFGGGERIEHDQQREADRVRDQHLLRGIYGVGRRDDRVRHVRVDRLLASRGA